MPRHNARLRVTPEPPALLRRAISCGIRTAATPRPSRHPAAVTRANVTPQVKPQNQFFVSPLHDLGGSSLLGHQATLGLQPHQPRRTNNFIFCPFFGRQTTPNHAEPRETPPTSGQRCFSSSMGWWASRILFLPLFGRQTQPNKTEQNRISTYLVPPN